MNKLYILILLTIAPTAWGLTTLDDCLLDAQSFASHKHPVQPLEECADLVKEHSEKLEVKSTDGKFHLFGFGNMFYVDGPEGRMLMAGSQTHLNGIKKAWIDTLNRRIFILQSDSLLTFDLDFIGNVSPLKLVKSPILPTLKKIELLPDETLMILTLEDGTIHKANSDAESRNSLSAKKPLVFKVP